MLLNNYYCHRIIFMKLVIESDRKIVATGSDADSVLLLKHAS